MIRVLDGKGNLKEATNRVSNAEHWDIYHRAVRDRPDMVEAMYDTIHVIVTSGRYLGSDGRFPNSTWLGSELLKTWGRKADWDAFCGSEHASNALFGEIMWTVMFDDDRDWATTLTDKANTNREERVYWLA
jgi:hypothetical protein